MRSFLLAACLLCVLAAPAVAQTSYPMITHTMPVALQRGKTTRVVVSGQQNFAGVYKALFNGRGIPAKVVPPAKAPAVVRSVTLDVTVAADVKPGVREFRLASNLGMSSVGLLVVSDYAVFEEKGNNN